MATHKTERPAGPITELAEVYDLLAAHPGFRMAQVTPHPERSRTVGWLGRIIKEAWLLQFGAEFAKSLTLLHFQLQRQGPRSISVDLYWHATESLSDWSVFIHFLDEKGNISFQGDYPLEGETPDALGLFYSRRNVEVPAEVPAGPYRTRLGVWSPRHATHLQLVRLRGCVRESQQWCHNAVLLDQLTL